MPRESFSDAADLRIVPFDPKRIHVSESTEIMEVPGGSCKT